MTRIRQCPEYLQEEYESYTHINLLFYGTVLFGMAVCIWRPDLHRYIDEITQRDLQRYALGRRVSRACDEGAVVTAAALIFLVNLFAGVLFYITLPSLILPYASVPLLFIRAAMWGPLLFPTSLQSLVQQSPHLLTAVLEGQVYVLAALPGLVHAPSASFATFTSMSNYLEWIRAGCQAHVHMMHLWLPLLVLSAAYEAVEVIYLLPSSSPAQHVKTM